MAGSPLIERIAYAKAVSSDSLFMTAPLLFPNKISFMSAPSLLGNLLNVYENIVLPVELDGDTVDQKFMDEVVRLLALENKPAPL